MPEILLIELAETVAKNKSLPVFSPLFLGRVLHLAKHSNFFSCSVKKEFTRFDLCSPYVHAYTRSLISPFHLSSWDALVKSLGSRCLLLMLFLPLAGSLVISCSHCSECFFLSFFSQLTTKPLREVQSSLHQPETCTAWLQNTHKKYPAHTYLSKCVRGFIFQDCMHKYGKKPQQIREKKPKYFALNLWNPFFDLVSQSNKYCNKHINTHTHTFGWAWQRQQSSKHFSPGFENIYREIGHCSHSNAGK